MRGIQSWAQYAESGRKNSHPYRGRPLQPPQGVERGNVVGIVTAKLSAAAALEASGALPENVNYAAKGSFLLGFLESVPDLSAKLKEPNPKDEKLEAAVKSSQQAAVLVLVYLIHVYLQKTKTALKLMKGSDRGVDEAVREMN